MFVPALKPQDFTILEDNKPQKITSFDVENVDAVPTLDVAQVKQLPETATAPVETCDGLWRLIGAASKIGA